MAKPRKVRKRGDLQAEASPATKASREGIEDQKPNGKAVQCPASADGSGGSSESTSENADGEPLELTHDPHGSTDTFVARVFDKRSVRVFTVIGGIAAVIALVPSFLQLWKDDPSPPTPVIPETSLRVVNLSVQRPSEVEADFHEDEGPTKKGAIENVLVDLSIKNTGRTAAVIQKAVFRIRFAKQMEDCREAGGGPLVVSAQYSVRIPAKLGPLPFPVERKMSYTIKPGEVERLAFSVGPSEYGGNIIEPWLYVFDVDLHHDGTSSPLHAGTAAVVGPSGDGDYNLDRSSIEQMDCIKDNQRTVDDAFQIPAVRASEFETMRSRLAKMGPPVGDPAKPSCVGKATRSIQSLCATYAYGILTISAILVDLPEAERSQVLVKLAGELDLRKQALVWYGRDSTDLSNQLLFWDIGCLTDQSEPEHREPCSTTKANAGEDDSILEIGIPLPIDYPEKLELSVELRRSGSGAAKVIEVVPSLTPMVVQRGR